MFKRLFLILMVIDGIFLIAKTKNKGDISQQDQKRNFTFN
jgi:hypothetical protein